MRIDVIKILIIVAPIIKELLDNRVPKKTTNLYTNSASSNDKVMDSLQELAIKVKSQSNPETLENDKKNLQIGINIVRTNIEAYTGRLQAIEKMIGEDIG